MIRIVVCLKEVPDPDAVNSFAVAGRLAIADDGRTLAQAAITRLTNAYDEQAIEAALRIRDAGVECTITAVSVGNDCAAMLKRGAALGADEIVAIAPPADVDWHLVAALLAGYIRQRGDVDLVLCGRQASDDDQGVVPALIGASLGMPTVTIARAMAIAPEGAGSAARVTRVTPDGDETVEVTLPAVVTISSELGPPRYPTAARSMAARKMQPQIISHETLGIAAADLRTRVRLERMYVPEAGGDCEIIGGDTPAALASALMARLRAEGIVR